MEISSLPALELGRLIKKREVSCKEAVKAQLEKIKERDRLYNSYIIVTEKQALERAEKVQSAIDEGEYSHSPLAGVPMAVKDNICTKNVLTSCASKMLSDHMPVYSATAVKRLESAGAIMLGKLNMDEFAMGSTSETGFYGPVKNPWDRERVAGGSSGGSSAAVAAEEAFYSLGTDTGGSIRLPAAFCGVTGIKPTYGRVSRYGLITYASSLDQIGPMARTVSDCAAVLDIISGWDEKDSTSLKLPAEDLCSSLVDDVKGLKIGIPSICIGDDVDEDVRDRVLHSAKLLEEKGAELQVFDLKMQEYAAAAYYIIASSEASSNLARYDGVIYGFRPEGYEDLRDMYIKSRSEGFGYEVKRRMIMGTYMLSNYEKYYDRAVKLRRLIKEAYDRAFDSFDVLIGPVAPGTALKLGEGKKDPLRTYLEDIFTVSANLAGLPALSMPCGLDSAGLPIGLQITAPCLREDRLIRTAYSLEREFPYKRPPEIEGDHAGI